MLTSFALALSCVAPSTIESNRAHPTFVVDEAPLECAFQLTPTHFVAQNFSDSTQVLVFVAGPIVEMRWLTPGAAYEWSREGLTLNGIELEVATVHDTQWRMSGRYSLSQFAQPSVDTLWIQGGATQIGWTQAGTTWSPAAQQASYLPLGMEGRVQSNNLVGTPAATAVPVHVPAITPSGGNRRPAPPPVEKDPLPVV
jgi:hypothetical protein